MTDDAMKKIEEKIHKDLSLTDERKVELLRLLTTMKSKVADVFDRAGYSERSVRDNEKIIDGTMRQANRRKRPGI
jgi:phosphopentomutase